MYIEDNTRKILHVSVIPIGKVFKHGDDYFLRIPKTKTTDFDVGYINAVNLETGKPASFESNDVIEILENAKVVIE